MAGHGEGGENGAGEDDVLCGWTGFSSRGFLVFLSREEPGAHNGSRHFGGAKVVDVHCQKNFISNPVSGIHLQTEAVATHCCIVQPPGPCHPSTARALRGQQGTTQFQEGAHRSRPLHQQSRPLHSWAQRHQPQWSGNVASLAALLRLL